MTSHSIRLNYSKAKIVFSNILSAVEQRSYPFNKPLVQDPHNLPKGLEWGSREHALILWAIDYYMKGGINSEVAIVNIGTFFEDYPEVFMPEHVGRLSQSKQNELADWLGKILPTYGLGVNINQVRAQWVWNAIKLAQFWDNDPRNLFSGVRSSAQLTWTSYSAAKLSYDSLCKVVIRNREYTHDELMKTEFGFYGYAHKMVSMLSYFFIHAGMVEPFAYPVPVDFHILRVLISTGILQIRGARGRSARSRERFLPKAREATLRYVVESGADPQKLADGLWILSRSNCRLHPGNKCSVEKTRKARRRHITEIPVVWNEENERRYDRACGICPVEQYCKWNVPSAYYYVKGIILIRGKRERPNPAQMKLLNVAPSPPSENSNWKNPEIEIVNDRVIEAAGQGTFPELISTASMI